MNSDFKDADLFSAGIAAWGRRVRQGDLTFTETVQHCLQQITAKESLNSFEFVSAETAMSTAALLDTYLAAGTDLGPLMGLPLGVKDIIHVNGMPTTFGSNAELNDLLGTEGGVISTLRGAGVILMGKTKTVEFALGATGVNESRGTPWNPADLSTHRIPGGSSSGSAVSTAAGLVGMALGTDTGGSIRIPASFTGLVGHKTSVGQWPLDGIFSLSKTLDSVGPLCRRVDDALLMHQLFSGERVNDKVNVKGLRIGIVEDLFFEDLEDTVAKDFERVCSVLEAHGAIRVPLSFPAIHERISLFASIVPAELIQYLTPKRYLSLQNGVDSVTNDRASVGLDAKAHAYLNALQRRRELIAIANLSFNDVDVWMSPTCPFVAMPVADLKDADNHKRALLASRNTMPGNLLDMCGLSLPMHKSGMPTGLQLMMPLNRDTRLLSLGRKVEALLDASSE